VKWRILTVFPDFVQGALQWGVLGRAISSGRIEVEVVNLRDFTHDQHRTTDDYAFGGGGGMVMKPEPFFEFWDSLPEAEPKPYVVYPSPQGERFTSETAKQWALESSMVFFCGRYEGLDQRILSLVDCEVSLGDFVTTGAELPLLVMLDATSRFVPGVVGNSDSVSNDSFFAGLLDHDNYTRPATFRGMDVPEVLTSGNHARIERERMKSSLRNTLRKRPDLFLKKELSPSEKKALVELFKECFSDAE